MLLQNGIFYEFVPIMNSAHDNIKTLRENVTMKSTVGKCVMITHSDWNVTRATWRLHRNALINL